MFLELQKNILILLNHIVSSNLLVKYLAFFLANITIFIVFLLLFIIKTQSKKIFFLKRALILSLSVFIFSYLISLIFLEKRPLYIIEGLFYKKSFLSLIALPSFPSVHTALLFAWGMLFLTENKRIAILIIGLSLLCGMSRVALGYHWPIDILGGILISYIIFSFSKKYLWQL
ncbi:phosphatase PAP2 family protein [bacterium]|nr:phosphatase PAP2 family protein [bacterium]